MSLYSKSNYVESWKMAKNNLKIELRSLIFQISYLKNGNNLRIRTTRR